MQTWIQKKKDSTAWAPRCYAIFLIKKIMPAMRRSQLSKLHYMRKEDNFWDLFSLLFFNLLIWIYFDSTMGKKRGAFNRPHAASCKLRPLQFKLNGRASYIICEFLMVANPGKENKNFVRSYAEIYKHRIFAALLWISRLPWWNNESMISRIRILGYRNFLLFFFKVLMEFFFFPFIFGVTICCTCSESHLVFFFTKLSQL